MLVGCGHSDKEGEENVKPAETLFSEGEQALEEQEYSKAQEAFEELEHQHPFSDLAEKAHFLSGYASYMNRDYTNAVAILERYIHLYPASEDTPYAYHLKALSYYEQISDVARDQALTLQAQDALRELIARFPTSDYAREARLKLDLVEDHLAGKEMNIGRYYLRQHKYIGAVNRFRTVLERYQTTSHVPEALHRMTEAYLSLGVRHEAMKYAAVLGHNYPGSPWYERSYALLTQEGEEPLEENWWQEFTGYF